MSGTCLPLFFIFLPFSYGRFPDLGRPSPSYIAFVVTVTTVAGVRPSRMVVAVPTMTILANGLEVHLASISHFPEFRSPTRVRTSIHGVKARSPAIRRPEIIVTDFSCTPPRLRSSYSRVRVLRVADYTSGVCALCGALTVYACPMRDSNSQPYP